MSDVKTDYSDAVKTQKDADVSGYLRVQDLSKKTRKRQYLDQFGKDAHNVTDASGKTRGRSKSEFQRATHYIIKKRK